MDEKLIWRSREGQRAYDSPNSGLPIAYRRILRLVERPTPVADVKSQLADHSPKQINDWLDELETLCFIHASRLNEADLRHAA